MAATSAGPRSTAAPSNAAPSTAQSRQQKSTFRGLIGVRHFEQLPLRWRVLLSQLPLTITVGMIVLLLALWHPHHVFDDPAFRLGVYGVGILTVLSLAVPWHRLPYGSYWVIPLLDFVAIGGIFDGGRHAMSGLVLLTAFPVIWLTWSTVAPKTAIAISTAAPAAILATMHISDQLPFSGESVVRHAVVPIMMLGLAVTSTVLVRSMERQADALEKALASERHQARLLESVLDAADVGIVVVDRDGHDQLMNAAQKKTHMLGTPEHLDDASEDQLLVFEPDGVTPIPAEERPVHVALRGENFQGRLIKIGLAGSQQAFAVSARSLRDEQGAFDGTVVAFHNVTDLMEAIASREEFFAAVTHELRTPLTSIIGYAELGLDTHPDSASASSFAVIHRNSERMLGLVDRLLDAASSFSDKHPEPMDLARVLRHSIESAAIRARNRGITMESDIPESLPIVADIVQLGQIADNLVSNAIKYTEDGGTVRVEAALDGSWARFSVADTGIGMTPEEQQSAFRSFYRTEHVRRAAIPGTGLGLAITQAMIQDHGGEISVASAPGVGSTFTVQLPAAGSPVGAAGGETTSSVAVSAARATVDP